MSRASGSASSSGGLSAPHSPPLVTSPPPAKKPKVAAPHAAAAGGSITHFFRPQGSASAAKTISQTSTQQRPTQKPTHISPVASGYHPSSTAATAAAAARSATQTAVRPPPRTVVHRTLTIGAVTIRVVQADLAQVRVEAIVNAANSLSFTPMDGGVSGALRRACLPAQVTGVKKTWWTDEGVEQSTVELPVTQAGVQPAAGGLLERGVQHIIHAVGPNWCDHKIAPATFKIVLPQIRRTVRRALNAAARIGAASCALPAISGGIFTHFKVGSDIKEREQRAARRAVIEATIAWAEEQQRQQNQQSATDADQTVAAAASAAAAASTSASPLVSSSLIAIDLCDLSQREKGAVEVFIEEFDAVLQARSAAATATAAASASTSPAA